NLTCLTGMDSLQGYLDGPPQGMGIAIADPINGVHGLLAVLAALRHHRRTGEGQYIDLSQWQAITSMLGEDLLDCVMNGRVRTPQANRDPMQAPHGVYPTLGDDRWIAIAVATNPQWRALAHVLDAPDLAADRRFADSYRRKRHEDALDARLAELTRAHDNQSLAARLQAAGVPAAPARSLPELFTDAHFLARRDWVEIDHP